MDLSRIFNSRVRRDILELYFANEGREFYLRELEKLLKTPVSVIRREMVKLEKDGIFNLKKVAKSSFYSLNKNYPFYNELRSMVLKAAKMGIHPSKNRPPVDIRDPSILLIYLFGSQAKGKAGPFSDADIGVLLKNSVSAERYIDYQLKLAGEFKDWFGKSDIVVTVMNNAPVLLLYEIIQHGKILHEKDGKTRLDFEMRVMREYFDIEHQRRVNDLYLFSHIKERYYGIRSKKYFGTFG